LQSSIDNLQSTIFNLTTDKRQATNPASARLRAAGRRMTDLRLCIDPLQIVDWRLSIGDLVIVD
jgi:hypothetical protein